MSTTEDVRLEGEKLLGERTISRAVAEFSAGAGRTIDVRIVPYGVSADVSDGGPLYREMWMPGAFADQVRGAEAGRARQVFVNFEHGNRLSDVVGHGLTLREGPDGFYGSFELHDTADGEKARYMVEQGVLDGVSLEAFPKKSVRSKDGVVQRVKAHLVNIALCRRPAFDGAGVLALREEELMEDETLVVRAPALADETRIRLHKLGIVIPGEEVELAERTFTDRPWDGSSSRWDTAEAYAESCVIDLNPFGKSKTKQRSYLPIREPGEKALVNVNAVRDALAQLSRGFPTGASHSQRESARNSLERLLDQANGSAVRAAPAATTEDTGTGEEEAIGHIESMLETAQQYMQAEPDTEDKATMARIMGLLRELHQKDAAEAN